MVGDTTQGVGVTELSLEGAGETELSLEGVDETELSLAGVTELFCPLVEVGVAGFSLWEDAGVTMELSIAEPSVVDSVAWVDVESG